MQRILIADRDCHVRQSLKEILRSTNIKMFFWEAIDGDAAWDIICSTPPELVVANLHLGEINAFALNTKIGHLLAQANYVYPNKPIIIYTDKEVSEFDRYWCTRSSLIYDYISIKDGFLDLTESLKKYFMENKFPSNQD
jgi:PleD family two-component response regulator